MVWGPDAQDWSSSGPPALYMTLYNTPKLCVIVNLSLLIISSPPWYMV